MDPDSGLSFSFVRKCNHLYCRLFIVFCPNRILLPSYNKFLGKEMSMANTNVFVYSALLLILFIFLSGIIPALYLSNFRPVNTLKGNFSRSKHGVWLRNSILTLQLIISSFFIICSFIIHSQVQYMLDKDLGFNGNQVVEIDFKKTDYRDNYNYKNT